MAEFMADPSPMEGITAELKSISSRIDSSATAVFSATQGINSIKSLKNKGYVGMIDSVRSSLRILVDETSTMSSRLSQIADLYSRTETTVRMSFQSDVFSGDEYSGSSKAAIIRNNLTREHAGDPKRNPTLPLDPDEVWSIITGQLGKNITNAEEWLEDGHRWRATTGKKAVDKLLSWAEGIPELKNTFKMIVSDYNKKLTDYESMLIGVLHPTNTKALSNAGKAFLNQIGFGWTVGVADRLKRETDFYVQTGAQQIVDGHVLQGIGTAIGGSLLAFGDMAVNTSAKTFKIVAKQNEGIKEGVKWINTIVEVKTGESAEKWVDVGLGTVGSSIRSGFESALVN